MKSTAKTVYHIALLGAFVLSGVTLVASQPLPGGKARFSFGEGNFDTVSATWVRTGNWSFDSAAGTVVENYWQWDSTQERDKVAFHTHTCTLDGVTKTCTTYTQYGWTGTGVYWNGTYTYDTSTGALHIDWPGGYWENWTVSNPVTGLAAAVFVSNNYGITHGKAYGSNASFSTFKTISQMLPGKLFTGTRAAASWDGSTITVTDWTSSGVSIDTSSGWSVNSPANTMHAWLGADGGPCSGCAGGGDPTKPGRVYHFISDNTSRKITYNNFCACLPYASEWPCYGRGLHYLAFLQIIDDSGNLRGMIGVGAEDPVNTPSFYAYQVMELRDF
jgi:hypothetical protein